MMIDEFQKKLRWFVARRGKPQVIISDKAKALNAAKKWLECFKKSVDVNSCLSTERIKWQHNLSSSPWWGGLFERMIGVMTYALSKAIGAIHKGRPSTRGGGGSGEIGQTRT